MIRDYWKAGHLDELDPGLLHDAIDEDSRDRLGSIGPSFMGDEYLPDYSGSGGTISIKLSPNALPGVVGAANSEEWVSPHVR